jgi:two-component system, OmpR family, sensor histidine kinase MprB
MTFRSRMVLAAVGVGVFAILAASIGAYLASRNALINSVDDVLQSTVTNVVDHLPVVAVETNGQVAEIRSPYVQFYTPSAPPSSPVLPVTSSVRAVAEGHAHSYTTDIRVNGAQWREYVTRYDGPLRILGIPVFGSGGALQVAAPLTGVNDQLGGLGLGLLFVALAALILTILIGWFVSRTAVGPLNELTAAVEELARTTNVSERLEPGGEDELGRLRRAFNRLIGALESSRESQQQLVMDASHELRTPLTSLRTNLEIVRRIDELSEPEREVLVADVLTQMQELTNLVGDLAELARGARTEEEATTLRLDQLVEDVVQLAASHGRQRAVAFRSDLDVVWVHGRRDRISRAIGNLLDNALKWSPDGATVDVLCRAGDVVVRDRGPGIDPEDLPHIFDRFYRARAARARPGSGLGLAIVAQVASEEGGSVRAQNATDGGAIVTLHLPASAPPADPTADLDATDTVHALHNGSTAETRLPQA